MLSPADRPFGNRIANGFRHLSQISENGEMKMGCGKGNGKMAKGIYDVKMGNKKWINRKWNLKYECEIENQK